ncbi:glycoside hydrolase family 9 protein [Nitratireductor soli]|uniref:glycoside hydrolase family 9 protein n=1 Tax=Nitratireductor soli TaxID=1670619 RepID=UPI00065E6940|nr:glycoside hydrolase family 9 protein [Nitratireductor soli]
MVRRFSKHGLFLLAAILPANAIAGDLLTGPSLDAWWATDNVRLEQRDGALCATAMGGTSKPWDALIGINGIALAEGTDYRISVTASGAPALPTRLVVQQGQEPWTPYGDVMIHPAAEPKAFESTFTAPQTRRDAAIVIQLGGQAEDRSICLNALSVNEGTAPTAAGTPPIRINQAGYTSDGPKKATLVSDSEMPLKWQLLRAGGKAVAEGTTRRFGYDKASRLETHLIDFSDVSETGDGFRLVAASSESHPFSIDDSLYNRLRTDALSLFYPMRSGIEIDGAVAGEAYARPAGHLGQAPNRGDIAVPCLETAASRKIYGERWSCGYELDVSGGWYDAGDHGKYVVNGGFAVAQMMGAYERALIRGKNGSNALSDGWLRIPEAGNGMPDILDEARWELDFLMKMAVPEGQPHQGMAHHSVHDIRWTPLPLLPHQDAERRALYRPSTAATLNLAAAAAQGARLFRRWDAAYADRLLEAARRAYDAAEREPALFMPPTDGMDGGGAYDDDDVADEFFWAAAELFITTGESRFLDRLKASPYWRDAVFDELSISWRDVSGLARLQLATVPSQLPPTDRQAMQRAVIASAEALLTAQSREAFGLLFAPRNEHYGWGSNSAVAQNMIIVASAYDLTGDPRYRAAVRESMDYLLGRNALGISYVTGYGTFYAQNQHSRWFAHSVDPSLPRPPDGALAGGPNVDLSDAVSARKLKGCAPQACYVDDIEAFATNEMGINWNAPLAWIASFLADS